MPLTKRRDLDIPDEIPHYDLVLAARVAYLHLHLLPGPNLTGEQIDEDVAVLTQRMQPQLPWRASADGYMCMCMLSGCQLVSELSICASSSGVSVLNEKERGGGRGKNTHTKRSFRPARTNFQVVVSSLSCEITAASLHTFALSPISLVPRTKHILFDTGNWENVS